MNCVFYYKSVNFGTELQHVQAIVSGCKASAKLVAMVTIFDIFQSGRLKYFH